MAFLPNRAILLTPPGGAAIAVMRLCGPGVGPFLIAHFRKTVRPGRAVHGDLSDGANVLDDPVIVVSRGGVTADINLHGGPWVVRSALELASAAGFEIVPPPAAGTEWPAEAVDAANELEQEMLTHLPLARTELALRVLLAQPAAWQRLLGAAESPLAFSESPKGSLGADRVGDALRAVSRTRESVRDAGPAGAAPGAMNCADMDRMLGDRSLWWLLHPPRVAVVGPANAGKSTLANELFAQQRSITADLPGTTRDWVGEIADIDGLPVMLVDTPGLRATADPIESEAIDRAREQIAAADLVIVVIDASVPLDSRQTPLIDAFPGAIRVLNKSDLATAGRPTLPDAIATVATCGEGMEALRRAITMHFGCAAIEISRPRWWTQRQRQWLAEARPPKGR